MTSEKLLHTLTVILVGFDIGFYIVLSLCILFGIFWVLKETIKLMARGGKK